MNRTVAFLLFAFLCLSGMAQSGGPVMADRMREDGKIFVVIAVIAVIFLSILVFLVFIERRLAKLERRLEAGKETDNIK